jgi:hypothetical protein
MRIIIEPTNEVDTSLPYDCVNHRVLVEHPSDDVGLEHVAFMVARALVAFGYAEEQVKECIKVE